LESEPAASGTVDLREDLLVDRARRGDADAFGRLYELHLDRIYRYVYYRVGSSNEAEDLTEHVFLKAWEAIGRYESRGLPFGAWLYRMAHNAVIDHYRARRLTTPIDETLDLEDERQNPVASAEALFDREVLKVAVRRLNADQQTVILLRFTEGLSHAEVGKILGKSEGAVRVIQHRALGAMAKFLRSLPSAGPSDA
jgi:RNA polymerase sigma-70 factor (ECF subfamily)